MRTSRGEVSYSRRAVTIDRITGLRVRATGSSVGSTFWTKDSHVALLVYPNVAARDVIEKPDAIVFADDLIHPRSNVASQNQ